MNRGFNLSWCRNVGAKHARGEKIILMDSDMCFESEYLDQVAKKHGFIEQTL
jgi:glycosyltransferase involved in cell wall biosynthesis